MIKKIKNKGRVIVNKSRIGFRYLSVFKKPIVTPKPRIIFFCDGLFSHGGLLDRIKGIISFYEAAKILEYDFFIYFNHPFELNEFLLPNEVSWNIDKREMNFSVFDSKVIYGMNDFNFNPLDEIKKSKVQNYLVYANIDYLPTLYKNNTQKENERLWRTNFTELFVKSIVLENELITLPSLKRLVFHLRFTSLMGDFKDTTQNILNLEERILLIGEIMLQINEKVGDCPSELVYVVSDSSFFLDYIKEYTKFNVLPGKPIHVDFSNNDVISNQSHLKTFLDFFFISECDCIVMIRLDLMYYSSFSRYAAILGDKPFSIIQ
ncbi:hypothetical protein CXF59_07220 [Flavobacterium sp. ALD4]|uniref:hypothetical protein n=1 Tax=Flavobacterium sp. ALD4 TaxID=2058314 RepID=UPI000C32AC44|nr:hypothetical protein [Flavobacterium sp. ALD4]PKH67689.1 hypothetical protein CXF59_07220 [Flavobacterium sp. ALD4]